MTRLLPPELQAQLDRLALLSDDEIDTTDIPEQLEWRDPTRGRFTNQKIAHRSYDVRALANWFLDQADALGANLTNMALNKLVYLAVERFLAERHVLLTPARIEAWDHGPVFRELYQAFSANGKHPIASRAKRFDVALRAMVEASEFFEPEDVAFLEEIMRRYGGRSAAQLRAISHVENGPWDSVWRYRGRSNPGMEITAPVIFEKAPHWREVNEKKRGDS